MVEFVKAENISIQRTSILMIHNNSYKYVIISKNEFVKTNRQLIWKDIYSYDGSNCMDRNIIIIHFSNYI